MFNKRNLILIVSLALCLCSEAKLLKIVNSEFNVLKKVGDSCIPSSFLYVITLQNHLDLVLFIKGEGELKGERDQRFISQR